MPQLTSSSGGDGVGARLCSHQWRLAGGKMLHRSWFQAKSRWTATQRAASVPSQSNGWTQASPCQKRAFKALPGPQTSLSISERNDPFLSPSASVGFKGIVTEWPNREFCNPLYQYLSQVWSGYSTVKVLHIQSVETGHFFHGLSGYCQLYKFTQTALTNTDHLKIKDSMISNMLVPCSTLLGTELVSAKTGLRLSKWISRTNPSPTGVFWIS